jgi:predicted component of type VI protein secretion system
LGSDERNDICIKESGIDELHCKIIYNSDTGSFQLFVSGRTGLVVDSSYYSQGEMVQLENGSEICLQGWSAVFNLNQ